MADKYGYMAKIGVDTSGLDYALKDIDGEIKNLESSLKSVEKSIEAAEAVGIDASDQQKAKFDILGEETKALSEKLIALEEIQNKVAEAWQNKAINVTEWSNFNSTLTNTRTRLAEIEVEMNKTADSMKNGSSGIREEGKSAEEAAGKNKKLGDSFAYAGDKGELFGIQLKANLVSSAIQKGLEKLNEIVHKTAEELKAIVVETAAAGDTIDKQSQRLGMTTESYQEWDYILSQNGADISTLTTSMRTLTNAVDDAQKGSKNAVNAFKRLGINVAELNEKTGEQQFSMVITALQGISDETERNSIANDLLSRSYQQLIPLLNQSAGKVEELRQKAHDTNQIMSEEAVKAAVNYKDSMDTLKRSTEGIKNRIGADLLPGITEIINGITDLENGTKSGADAIEKGISDTIEGIGNAAEKVVDIMGTMSKAAADNAPEISGKIVEAIKNSKNEIRTTTREMLGNVKDVILETLPDMGTLGGEIVVSIGDGILEAIKSSPEAVAKFTQAGQNFCDAIADGIVHYDWGNATVTFTNNLADLLDPRMNGLSDFADAVDMPTWAKAALGIPADGQKTLADYMRLGADEIGDAIDNASGSIADAYDKGRAIIDGASESYDDAIKGTSPEENAKNVQAILDKYKKQVENQTKFVGEEKSALEKSLEELDHLYKIHQLSEEQYYEKRKEVLETYRNTYSEEWWKYYDEVENFYKKQQDETNDLIKENADKELKAWTDSADDISKAIEDKYKQVTKNFESAKSEYVKALDLSHEVQLANGSNKLVLDDLTEQTKALQKYRQDMAKLQETGISTEHLANIQSMSYDDRAAYVDALLGMTDANRQRYYRDYEAYLKEAALTAQQDVQDELIEANNAAVNGLDGILGSIPESAYEKGKETAISYLKGFEEYMNGANTSVLSPYISEVYRKSEVSAAQSYNAASSFMQGMTGDFVINVAGQEVLRTSMSKILEEIKNSGGIIGV